MRVDALDNEVVFLIWEKSLFHFFLPAEFGNVDHPLNLAANIDNGAEGIKFINFAPYFLADFIDVGDFSPGINFEGFQG